MKLWDRSHILPLERQTTERMYWTNDVPLESWSNGVAVIVDAEPAETLLIRAVEKILKHVESYYF